MHCVLEDPSTRLAALQFFQEMISANVKKSQIHVSPLALDENNVPYVTDYMGMNVLWDVLVGFMCAHLF